MIFQQHFNPETALFKLIGSMELRGLLELLDIHEFFEANPITNPTTAYLCSIIPSICNDLISFVSDSDSDLINKDRLQVWTGHYPSGTSVKNLLHYQQMIAQTELVFRKYDYGSSLNLMIYNRTSPPEYDLTLIQEEFYLYAGLRDKMSSIVDVRSARKLLKNVIYKEIDAGHLSFLLGKKGDYLSEVVTILKESR